MENPMKEKSFAFAIQIVDLYKDLTITKKEFVMSKQLLRSGTSIGALYREAEHAESKKDFIHKMSIAQKECNEVLYWLELLEQTDYIEKEKFHNLHNLARELIRLITRIIKTTKSRM